MIIKRYPVRLSLWKSTRKLKDGKKEYPKFIINLPMAMKNELKDLLYMPASAYREDNKIIIEFKSIKT